MPKIHVDCHEEIKVNKIENVSMRASKIILEKTLDLNKTKFKICVSR